MSTPEDNYPLDEWEDSYEGSGNFSDFSGIPGSRTAFLTVQAVIYSVLFLTGIPGNILVFAVFARRDDGRPFNVTSYLTLSLATADLGVLIFYIPFYITYDMMGLVWPFGLFMCKLVFSATHVCVYASLGTLIAIAVERYMITCHMLVKKSCIGVVVMCVWTLALVLCTPQIMYYKLVRLDGQDEDGTPREYACELEWPDPLYEKLLHPIDLLLFYILPLAFVSALYFKVIRVLRVAIKRNVPSSRLVRESQSIVRVLVVMLAVFAVCVLPIHFLQICRVFFHEYWLMIAMDTPWLFSAFAALYLLTHSVNPIIYGLLHRQFRREAAENLKRFCKGLCCRLNVPLLRCREASRRGFLHSTRDSNEY